MQTDKWITKRHWEESIGYVSDDAHLNIESLKEDVKIKEYFLEDFHDELGYYAYEYEIDNVKIIDIKHSNVRWCVVPKFEINGELQVDENSNNFDELHWNCLTLNYNPTELQNRNAAIVDITKFIIKGEENSKTEIDGEEKKLEIRSYSLISYETRLVCDIKVKYAVNSWEYYYTRRDNKN
jgi:hypothetical protein